MTSIYRKPSEYINSKSLDKVCYKQDLLQDYLPFQEPAGNQVGKCKGNLMIIS